MTYAMKWFVGIFVGFLVFTFFRMKGVMQLRILPGAQATNRYAGVIPSVTAPAPQNAFCIFTGATMVGACAQSDVQRGWGIPPSTNDPICLSADYASCAYGYVPTVSAKNLGVFCCYYGGQQIPNPQTPNAPTTCVGVLNTVPRRPVGTLYPPTQQPPLIVPDLTTGEVV